MDICLGEKLTPASKAYAAIVGSSQAPRQFIWLWKSTSRGRHKFFFWLLVLDCLNTRNLLRRKNFVLAKLLLCVGKCKR